MDRVCYIFGMRCSSDIRIRVISFVRDGGSKAEAARRFGVSRMSVFNWLRCGETVTQYSKPGPRTARKIDRLELQQHVKDYPDMTQAERGNIFGVSRFCIWHNLKQLRVSRKKNDALHAARHYEKKGVSAPT
jgi:transposase